MIDIGNGSEVGGQTSGYDREDIGFRPQRRASTLPFHTMLSNPCTIKVPSPGLPHAMPAECGAVPRRCRLSSGSVRSVIATVIDIGNGFGSKPAMLAATAARHAGRVRRRASTLPSVVGNC